MRRSGTLMSCEAKNPSLFVRISLSCLIVLFGLGSAAATVSISPKSIDFGSVTVGVPVGTLVTITNTGTSAITITSTTISPSPVFWMDDGTTPFLLGKGQKAQYSVRFAPTDAQAYSGQFELFFSDGTNFTVPLSGSGVITTAVAQISPSSINFGSHREGTTSTPQVVTISNTGSSPFVIESIKTFAPFSVPTFAPVTVQPGQSATTKVGFFSGPLGAKTGTVTVSYDVLPPAGVTVSGTSIAQTVLTSATFPTLPTATQGAAYLVTLAAVGGTAPYSWSIASGFTLPAGLALSSEGTISGTVTATDLAKTYTVGLHLTDSATPPATKNVSLLLPVGKPTGAACGNISFDVPGTSTPMVPINDLGTGTYQSVEGGLYPGGSNVRPPSHDAYGVTLAKSIQPLDANGNPDANGQYVLLSIGESDSEQEFFQFQTNAAADPSTNPHLVIVNGAQPDETADRLQDPNNAYWNQIVGQVLPASYVTPQQVVAVWLQSIHAKPSR